MALSESDMRRFCPPDDRSARTLPRGVAHGSLEALRLGCTCEACLARKKRAMRRGWRL